MGVTKLHERPSSVAIFDRDAPQHNDGLRVTESVLIFGGGGGGGE